MLVVVIATGKLIANGRFNTGVDLVPVCRVDSNTRIVVESEIVKASAGTKVGDNKKVLIRALPDCDRVENAHDAANSAGIDKVVTAGSSKGEVCILPVLVVVIGASGFIADRCI